MFSAIEQSQIGNALEQLAISQGVKKPDEKEQFFLIGQMEKWNRSANDIIQAIGLLYDVQLKSINLPKIRETLMNVKSANALPSADEETYYKSEEYRRKSRRVFGRTAQLKRIHGKDWFKFYNSSIENKPLCLDDEKFYERDFTIADITGSIDGKTMASGER